MEKIRVDASSPAVEMVHLRERHGEIEKRLAELDRHLSLTPDEQVERAQLKKEKLRAKDRLTALAAHLGAVASGAPPGDPVPA